MRVTTQFIPMMAIAGTLFVFNLWNSPNQSTPQANSQLTSIAPENATTTVTPPPARLDATTVEMPEADSSGMTLATPDGNANNQSLSASPIETAIQSDATLNSASPTASSIFPDVQSDPYAIDIDTAYQLGIVSGFDDGSFQPQTPVTREGATTLIVKLLAQQFPTTATMPQNNPESTSAVDQLQFPDVPSDHWSASAIDTAQAMGLIQGDDLGQFRPTATVTRAELMAIIHGAVAYAHQTTGHPVPSAQVSSIFEDVKGHWVAPLMGDLASFCPAIAAPLNDDNHTFAPEDPALRNYTARAAVQTYECLNAIAP